MPGTSLDLLLSQLEQQKGRFGLGEDARTERLLAALDRRRFPDPKPLIRFHEAVMFLRAFPQSAGVVQRTERILAAFHERVEVLRKAGVDLSPLDPMEVSGVAGTTLDETWNYGVTRWLHRRFPGQVNLVWDDSVSTNRLAETLPRFLPLLDDDAYVEADVPYHAWLRAARDGKGSDLAWLLDRFDRLPLADRERTELFDSLGLTIRWDLGTLRASRTCNWQPGRPIYYHRGPFIRRNAVDIAGEMTTPLPVARLSRRQGEATLNLMREVMTVRRRELWGTTHADPAQVLNADVGRGTYIYLWGLLPERRLPLRAYAAGLTIKNGVPIGYLEAIGLAEWMEVGFNTFYTFRDGESAWNYAQTLRLLRQVLGVTCISVYPYQIGLDNEEAIESGAFWFYRKLGFRPGRPDLLPLVEREESRIAKRPGYRSLASTLRKLAVGHLFFELPGTARGVWDHFRVRQVGFAAQRRMARAFGGDAGTCRGEAAAVVSKQLGVRVGAWRPLERKAFEDFAVVLSLVPDLARWTPEEKRGILRIVRAKAGPDEWRYLRLMQRHQRLRDAIVRLGSQAVTPAHAEP